MFQAYPIHDRNKFQIKNGGYVMFKISHPHQIKAIVLIGLIIGSIIFVKMIPVEITSGDAIKELHYLIK